MGDEADYLIDQELDSYWGDEFNLEGDLEYVPAQPRHAGDPCPKGCGGTLVLRKNKTTGVEFLGCSSFPKCKGY